MDAPRAGDRVVLMSGIVLGVVDRTQPGEFRVNSGETSLWLRHEAVFSTERGRVILVCERPGLRDYTVPEYDELTG